MAVTFARALYSFEGGRSDNLVFKEGDVITVLKQDSSGWWQGSTLDGRIGIFPRNYVELNEVRDSYDVAVAEFNFESDKDGDLTFKDGDEIIVLRHLSPEWWKGRATKDKREGVFPSSYVKLTGEVDYATADEEAAKWSAIVAQARSTTAEISKRREEAEKELEMERIKLEEANQQAAAARMAADAGTKKERDAKREEQLQKAKQQEVELSKAREEAERRHDEARQKLAAARIEEDANSKTVKAAEEKKEKAKKEKKDEDDRFADFEDPGKKPVREVKKVSKFANLGGGDKCPKCNQTVGHAEKAKGPGDTIWHNKCLRCSTCDKLLTGGNFSENNNQPYCSVCYGRGFGPKGFGFGGSVTADDGGGTGKDRKHAVGIVDDVSPMEALKKKKG
jgi:phage FluMu protein Com